MRRQTSQNRYQHEANSNLQLLCATLLFAHWLFKAISLLWVCPLRTRHSISRHDGYSNFTSKSVRTAFAPLAESPQVVCLTNENGKK